MFLRKRLIGSGIALVATLAMVSGAQAASYPKAMQVTAEVWNNSGQDLHMTYASWISTPEGLSPYFISGDGRGAQFGVTLNNPRQGSATFRYATQDGQVCQFTMGHEAQFSWFGLRPSPTKSASGTSIGTSPAECTASVIKGLNSNASYTVRFAMK